MKPDCDFVWIEALVFDPETDVTEELVKVYLDPVSGDADVVDPN